MPAYRIMLMRSGPRGGYVFFLPPVSKVVKIPDGCNFRISWPHSAFFIGKTENKHYIWVAYDFINGLQAGAEDKLAQTMPGQRDCKQSLK